MRTAPIALSLSLALSLIACPDRDQPGDGERVEITATELYDVFEADSAGATARFAGVSLVITGETSSIFSGGPPRSQPAITMRTESGGSVHGRGEALVHVLVELREGRPVTIECPGETARFWPAPNRSLELSDCAARPPATSPDDTAGASSPD